MEKHLTLLLVCLLCPLCGATEYFVKPTEPTNASCPGQPCLTLAQYTADSDHYFQSNNNTVFWFLSGTHNISLPVIITDAHNITLERYGERNGYPRILFEPSHYCLCAFEDTIMGVCKGCTAVQFYNISRATVKGLEIFGQRYNKTSSINGLSFIRSNDLVVQNILVETKNRDYTISDCLFFQNSLTKYELCNGVLLYKTLRTLLQNMVLNISDIYTDITQNTEIINVRVTNSARHGISSKHAVNTTVHRTTITGSTSHCLRLEHVHNISVTHSNITHCGDNGVWIEKANDTQLNQMSFLQIFSKAIYVTSRSINTYIANSFIEFCSPLYGIH